MEVEWAKGMFQDEGMACPKALGRKVLGVVEQSISS